MNRDIQTWVFDLDNTLYPARSSLFPQIDIRMRQFVAKTLDLSLDEAFTLQKAYYREFGTTLRGLMTNHGVLPDEFLSYVHDIDHSVLAPCPQLKAALSALPGRKIIFTNGSTRHAEQVLCQLQLADQFSGIFDIKDAGYAPKPHGAAYDTLIKRFGFDPAKAAMVEDLHRNLKPAFERGMMTLWVDQEDHPDAHMMLNAGDLDHVHHVTTDLAQWLSHLNASDKTLALTGV